MLTPDFRGKDGAAEQVFAAAPDVFNHNLETVPRLYPGIRPGARYYLSLKLLDKAKEANPALFTKSGIMVGLGEERAEVLAVMDDLRAAGVDFLTIGQYLQPTPKHAAVARFVPPDEFAEFKRVALAKGFLVVASTPLTRSSYHADRDFAAAQGGARRRRRGRLRAMPTHAEMRRLPYSREQMFDLVADVERYPEFLPWCAACRIKRRESPSAFTADLIIGFKMFRERFTSRVGLDRPQSGSTCPIRTARSAISTTTGGSRRPTTAAAPSTSTSTSSSSRKPCRR